MILLPICDGLSMNTIHSYVSEHPVKRAVISLLLAVSAGAVLTGCVRLQGLPLSAEKTTVDLNERTLSDVGLKTYLEVTTSPVNGRVRTGTSMRSPSRRSIISLAWM